MISINQKTLQDLEFATLLKTISSYCVTEIGTEKSFAIQPFKNEEELKRFIFLMCAENLISKEKESLLDILYRKNELGSSIFSSLFKKGINSASVENRL